MLEKLAGTTRLELATSAVTGQRSNQLNYVPNLKQSSPHYDAYGCTHEPPSRGNRTLNTDSILTYVGRSTTNTSSMSRLNIIKHLRVTMSSLLQCFPDGNSRVLLTVCLHERGFALLMATNSSGHWMNPLHTTAQKHSENKNLTASVYKSCNDNLSVILVAASALDRHLFAWIAVESRLRTNPGQGSAAHATRVCRFRNPGPSNWWLARTTSGSPHSRHCVPWQACHMHCQHVARHAASSLWRISPRLCLRSLALPASNRNPATIKFSTPSQVRAPDFCSFCIIHSLASIFPTTTRVPIRASTLPGISCSLKSNSSYGFWLSPFSSPSVISPVLFALLYCSHLFWLW